MDARRKEMNFGEAEGVFGPSPLQHGNLHSWDHKDEKKEDVDAYLEEKRQEVAQRIAEIVEKMKAERADAEYEKRLALIGRVFTFGFDLAGRVLALRAARHMEPGMKQTLTLSVGLTFCHLAGWIDGVTNPRWKNFLSDPSSRHSR
jgi:hypothetical protein